MEQFAQNLERFADRTIVDMTDLKGRYDFGFDTTCFRLSTLPGSPRQGRSTNA
jgi:uncharacterized protein (TIGR03435 family)